MFGGAGIYVSEKYSQFVHIRPDLDINLPGECEAKFIEISTKSCTKTHNSTKNIIIGSIYRHPHENHSDFFDALSAKLSEISHNTSIFLLGDLNINVSLLPSPVVITKGLK